MVALKQLTVLAAFIVAAALLPAKPARALTATAHPDLLGSERLAPVQAVGQHRCHGYRNGRRAYRHCASRGYRKPERRARFLGTSQTYGYYKPWRGFEPCANCPAFKIAEELIPPLAERPLRCGRCFLGLAFQPKRPVI